MTVARSIAADVTARARADADRLQAAYARYLTTAADLAAIVQCPATWPSDPAGPGYLGTRCDLLEGHLVRDGKPHRHRVKGSQAVIQW